MCVKVIGEGVNTCLADGECAIKPEEPAEPVAIFTATKKEVIKLNSEKIYLLPQKIIDASKKVALSATSTPAFVTVLAKSASKTEIHYLNTEEFLNNWGVKLPEGLASYFYRGKDYQMAFYVHEENNAVRAVMVIPLDVVGDKRDALNNVLRNWENTMPDDLKSLLMGAVIPVSQNNVFYDNVYKNVNIRYANFNDPKLSIDYAVMDNYLIFAASREAMYAVIDEMK